jgi:MFS family permease
MDPFKKDRLSRWTIAFFRWFCHPELREYIEGDLLELYHTRQAGLGTAKARWLLIRDVFNLFRPGIINNPNRHLQHFSIMKNIQWTKLVLINLLVALAVLSPFFPGPSNKLVLAISNVAQVIGVLGLAFVPLGIAWTFIQVRRSRTVKEESVDQKFHYRLAIGVILLIAFIFMVIAFYVPHTMPKVSFTIALLMILAGLAIGAKKAEQWKGGNKSMPGNGALIILATSAAAVLLFISLLLALAVFVGLGVLQGLLALVLLSAGMFWLIKRIGKMAIVNTTRFSQFPVYLATVPIMAFLVSTFLMRTASNFSRNYAIERSQSLIMAIEDYKIKEGLFRNRSMRLPFAIPAKSGSLL